MSLMTIPILFIIIFGIWPVDLIQGRLQRCCYRIYSVITLSFFATFLISLIAGCAILAGSPSVSPERKNSSFAVTLAITLATVKIMIYCKYRLLNLGHSVFEQEQKLVLNGAEEEKLYKKMTRYAHCMYFILSFVAGVGATFYMIEAFVGLNASDHKYWNLDDKSFMYELYLPFEKNRYIIWIIIGNVFAAFLVVTLRTSGNIMYYSLVLFGKLQLQLLQLRVRKFDERARKFNGDRKLAVVEFVKDHQETIRFIKNLNNCIKYPLLLEFLLNSFNLASVSFQIVTSIFVVSFIDMCVPLIFLCFLCLEIYIVAWTANEIKVQSLSVGDAICDGLWYEQEEHIKKLLVLIVLRTQKPLHLTIGPFRPLTTETIIWMLKASYSYLALMMKTYDKNRQLL